MANITNSEINIVTKFFENFTASVVRILSEKFDTDVFDKIDFPVNSVSMVSDTGKLKGNNSLYKFNCAVEDAKGSFAVVIPEEFIAIASELIMGGKAEGAYEGTLSELEVNASVDLFAKILDDIKFNFKSLYSKELVISQEPEIVLKKTPQYNETFKNTGFDFAISYNLKLGSEKDFEITVLTNAAAIKQLLINIDLLEEVMVQNISKMLPPKERDGFSDINNIADIKINIAAELGKIKLPIKQVLGLVSGSIIELDTYDNADIKVFANG
ncbi:MAG: FliM/FliN family flagellar motor switch protein, partial [bacterium]